MPQPHVRRNSLSAYPIDVHASTMVWSPTELMRSQNDNNELEEDVEDKRWRNESTLLVSPSSSWSMMAASNATSSCTRLKKRQHFWRNVVRQFNFTNEGERSALLMLTQGMDWMGMDCLPTAFIQRHRANYHLIATADYPRSNMIQRDVTRTFSIFEYSQLRGRGDVVAQQRALFRVLNAIAEAEDGYCQGMNFIAALFLVEGLEEADAYALFLYILRKRHLARMYLQHSSFLNDYLIQFDQLFARELPDLYQHMQGQGFVVQMYGIEWFTTLFSLSTKLDVAVAIFDLFFIGIHDIFFRVGLAILKLLESTLLCMVFEDFLREFKPLVRQIDPYQAILLALSFTSLEGTEDTTTRLARVHDEQSANTSIAPKTFARHRSLPPPLTHAIEQGDLENVSCLYDELQILLDQSNHSTTDHGMVTQVLANEVLHHAIWSGHVPIACFAIESARAQPDNQDDDTFLTPLHFAVLRNQPDMVRILLSLGVDTSIRGGRWKGREDGLTPLETSIYWHFRDTTAVRLILEDGNICLQCNTRWDTFSTILPVWRVNATCKQCSFKFCRRAPHAICIQTHSCRRNRDQSPPDHERPQQSQKNHRRRPSTRSKSITISNKCMIEEPVPLHDRPNQNHSSTSLSSMSSSSSSSSLSSTSRSSSFVYIASPISNVTVTTSDALVTNTTASNSDWFGSNTSITLQPQEDAQGQDIRITLAFPKHPEWYCNASECHKVFTFFSSGIECKSCHGFYCTEDFNSHYKMCHSCVSITPDTNR